VVGQVPIVLVKEVVVQACKQKRGVGITSKPQCRNDDNTCGSQRHCANDRTAGSLWARHRARRRSPRTDS